MPLPVGGAGYTGFLCKICEPTVKNFYIVVCMLYLTNSSILLIQDQKAKHLKMDCS